MSWGIRGERWKGGTGVGSFGFVLVARVWRGEVVLKVVALRWSGSFSSGVDRLNISKGSFGGGKGVVVCKGLPFSEAACLAGMARSFRTSS